VRQFSVLMPLTATLVIAPSLTQANGYYLQLDGGVSFLGETEVGTADIDYEAGLAVGGRLGIRADTLRFELDIAYSSNDFDSVNDVNLGDTGLDAELSALTFGVGAYLDIFPVGIIIPYAGAGAGLAYKELETNFGGDDDDTGLTAHGEVGASFDITKSISVVPHYRLVWLDEVGNDNQFAHWLRVGLRLNQ